MTWEQYWYGDPWMAQAFIEAERLRRERVNAEAHLYGLYVYDAVGCVVHDALKKKTEASAKYPSKPYPLEKQEEMETKYEREQREEKEKLQAQLYMQNMMRVGKHWGKK